MTLLGHRKFLISLASIASATAMVATGYISDSIYSTVMLAAIGIFAVANVSQKVMGAHDPQKP